MGKAQLKLLVSIESFLKILVILSLTLSVCLYSEFSDGRFSSKSIWIAAGISVVLIISFFINQKLKHYLIYQLVGKSLNLKPDTDFEIIKEPGQFQIVFFYKGVNPLSFEYERLYSSQLISSPEDLKFSFAAYRFETRDVLRFYDLVKSKQKEILDYRQGQVDLIQKVKRNLARSKLRLIKG